jgi:uncharacterized membrane protein
MSTLARRWCALGSVAMVVLHALWHGWLAPPAMLPKATFVLAMLPMLPALMLFALRHRRAPFWAAVAARPYFCHGIMEAWTDRTLAQAGVWPLGLAEAALAAWIVVTASWDGMRARFKRKSQAAPPV